MNKRWLPALLCAALGAAAQAQEPPAGLEAAPEPPPLPEPVRSGESLEPDVQIVPGRREGVTEYRVDGQLRAIRVEPEVGPIYFIVDTDGDGRLDTRTPRLGPDFGIAQWVLFSW
jgi:hypothetical protein